MKQVQKIGDIMRDLAQRPIIDEKSGEINIMSAWYNRQKSNDNGRK